MAWSLFGSTPAPAPKTLAPGPTNARLGAGATGSTAIGRASQLGAGPQPPDAQLANANAAAAATAAAAKAGKRAGSADALIPRPGAVTPPVTLNTKRLLGY